MMRAICVAVLLTALVAVVAAPASAQYANETADYYNNSSTSVNSSDWIDGRTNATVDNYAHFVSRLSTFVIGGGSGSDNVVLTGLFAAMALGMIAALAGVGVVGGAVLAIIVAGALVIAGFAPMWLYAIALFMLGALGTSLLRRVLQ